jgi:hypothetical protein
MTKNYLSNLKRLATESVRSASYRYRWINQNLGLIHAAVNWFVRAVAMPITKAVDALDVHSAVSRRQVAMKIISREQ